MLPTLWFGNASSTPTELTIREGEQVLGRAADADLCLSETFVSTYHARLTWQKGQLKVLDLNSTNGTLVNGVPVVGWTTLTDGDRIEFGGIEAVVALPTVIDLDDPSISFPPPPQHESRPTTGEFPQVPANGADDPAPTGRQLPDDGSTSQAGEAAPMYLPPTPPTGITITDIEAVTDGPGDSQSDVFGHDLGYHRPFRANNPERGFGWEENRHAMLENANRFEERPRPIRAAKRSGVSPVVIIIAVTLLVVVILAAVFLS